MPPAGPLEAERSSSGNRRWIRWIGALLALAATVFLFVQFREHASQLSVDQLRQSWGRVLLAAIGYFLCGIPLGIIWWLSVRGSGANSPSALGSALVHMASQLGKYLPGNLGHFAARHWMMRNRGAPDGALITAGILEALVLVIAAAVLGVAVIRPAAENLLEIEIPFIVQFVGLLLVLLMGVAIWSLARGRGWIDGSVPAGRAARNMIAALLVAVLFFLGMTGCFVLVSGTFTVLDFYSLVPWIAASWMLGFVVPGAPGGIGVREFVLVLGLSPLAGEAPALLDAALFRLVTVGGDALMAMVGSLILGLKKA